ncbi:MAG: HEPN domain-containing protein [Actinomycetota bacterium]|nr:MAG: HEPN domain-containing [Actinomycetota bacterium]MDO8950533.1 HEPN domain-containing protein [Actinomycetota bacterium]MDP3630802.1 HEPN domain-containing protein [Actinomycetota bacterium]
MNAPPDEAAEWLRYAAEDLCTAQRMIEVKGIPIRQVCVLCQQSAEKHLKAVLIRLGQRVPRVHGLVELRALSGVELAGDLTDGVLEDVTRWSVAGRYPVDWPEPVREDVELALHVAERVAYAVQVWFTEQESA